MRYTILAAILWPILFTSSQAEAYGGNMYGHGVWGGVRGCGYGHGGARGAYSRDDEWRDAKVEEEEAGRAVKEYKKEIRDLKKELQGNLTPRPKLFRTHFSNWNKNSPKCRQNVFLNWKTGLA